MMRNLTCAIAAATCLACSVHTLADTVEVDVLDSRFEPATVIVKAGDTVRWVWRGAVRHSSTSVSGIGESWDSGLMTTGEFEYNFANPGTFNYYCTLHGRDNGDGTANGMAGTVVVGEEFNLDSPVPGRAGEDNTWAMSGMVPDTRIFFVYGFREGTTAVPGCPGVEVGIQSPKIAGTTTSDGAGNGSFGGFVPNAASGRTILTQAVDLDFCRVSNLVAHTF